MAETTGRTPQSGPPEGAVAFVVGLLAAAAVIWGAHQLLPRVWPAGAIHPSDWLTATLRNITRPAVLDGVWFGAWRMGSHHYLAALAAIGLAVWGLILIPLTGRSIRIAPLALIAGGALGYAGGLALSRVPDLPVLLWLFGPALGVWLVGAVGVALVSPRPADDHVRGARVVTGRKVAAAPGAMAKAIRKGQICFAGTSLTAEAESTHMLAIGAPGSGKSTAIDDLQATAIARGDPMMVADPDGEAMSRYWRDGDRVLNPFDARCAKWDLFSDLTEETDSERVAASLLPMSGNEESERWTRRGRDLLATMMRT